MDNVDNIRKIAQTRILQKIIVKEKVRRAADAAGRNTQKKEAGRRGAK